MSKKANTVLIFKSGGRVGWGGMEKERNDDLVVLPSIPRKIVASIQIILKFPTSKVTAAKLYLSRTNPTYI